MDTTVFWGYGLYADKYGDYVKKTMNECTGEEILTGLAHHLHLEQELEELSSMLEYSTNQPVKVRRSTGRRERKGNRRPRT